MGKYIPTTAGRWLKLFICFLVMNTQLVHGSNEVNITFLESAASQGAVCIDGSPPAYYYDKGFGDGVNNWLILLQGGAWCARTDFCPRWVSDKSSWIRPKTMNFTDILSKTQTINPDFYNWNRVSVVYCDGSSFMGDVEDVYQTKNGVNITSRGFRVYNAVMEDLLAKGMNNANNAILSGSSAGGLAAILHCDGFRTLLPNASRVKCISDSGFFIRADKMINLPRDERKESTFERMFNHVVEFHGVAKFLPKSCTSRMRASLCFFPENLIEDIQTPLFILETSYDSYQIRTGLKQKNYNETVWTSCAEKLKDCTPDQLQNMKDYRSVFIDTLRKIGSSPSRGVFVHSCLTHFHFMNPQGQGWNTSPVLGNKTIAKAVGDWYFDRSSFHEIDTRGIMPQLCAKGV